jgi:HEAT repeat protein
MLFQIMDWNYPRVEEMMKEGLGSPHEDVRAASIWYWGQLENGKGIPFLIAALEDKSESNKKMAINGLGALHALDAVPSLIRLLENPDPKLRDLAGESLKQIRKHYEERAEWQRWYDETKKTLNK